jgi:hypothetical protein
VPSLADNGYLINPDTKIGRSFNPKAAPFSDLSRHECLVLLGEPGMGKTAAMEDARSEIEHRISSAGEGLLWINLNTCGSDHVLDRELFDNEAFGSWLVGERALNLFLDSVDECLLRINAVAPRLLKELGRGDRSRLRLRIACRTAEWPSVLQEGLTRLYGDELHVYELAPLRRIDVAEATGSFGLEAEKFLAEVTLREAVPFAIKPVTLKMLLRLFKRDGGLPSDLAALYRHGCRVLAEESNKARSDPACSPKVDPSARILVAQRIAAMMAFCQRGIVVRSGTPEAASTELCIGEIAGAGQREETETGHVDLTSKVVEEVLDTGLFSGRGPNQLGWAHQTYLEFLASEYVVAHGLAPEQTASLLMHPLEPTKVIPQLRGVAAWLAGRNLDVFDRICASDPQVLLRADVGTLDDNRKGRLIDAYLGQVEARTALVDWESIRYFARLKHTGLAARLGPYVKDRGLGIQTRIAAIEIVEECSAKDLQELLAGIALDATENISIRISAAGAIAKMGDSSTKRQLRPLANGDASDEDDSLKGMALEVLRTLWPCDISTEELFELMTPPNNLHHFGTYQDVVHKVVRSLRREDLPHALDWAARFPSRYHNYYFWRACKDIVRAAREHLDEPAVLAALAKVGRARMKLSERIWDEEMPLPPNLDRRAFIQAIIDDECTDDVLPNVTRSSRLDWWHQAMGEAPIVRAEDLAWVLGHFLQAETLAAKQCWSELLKIVVNHVCVGAYSVDPLIEAAVQTPALYELFPHVLGSIEIDSERARQLRVQEQADRRYTDVRRRNGPLLAQRMAQHLLRCESGEPTAFPLLLHQMAFGDNTADTADFWVEPIDRFPGWREGDASVRQRILDAGKRYLVDLRAKPLPRTRREVRVSREVRAAQVTLCLLGQIEPTWLEGAPLSGWQRWAAVIVDEVDQEYGPGRLVELAMNRAPEEFFSRLAHLIDWEDRMYQHAYTPRRVAQFWNSGLEEVLLAQVRDPKRAPSTVGDLLDLLLMKSSPGALKFACSLLPASLPKMRRARELACQAAEALLTHQPSPGWPHIWSLVAAHPDLGRNILVKAANVLHGRSDWSVALGEDDVANLYLWLNQEFPHANDPKRRPVGRIGDREQVADFRDSLLVGLSRRATPAAVGTLIRIKDTPGTPDIRLLIEHARRTMLERNWSPPSPQDLLAMAQDSRKRFVGSGGELRRVVLESLEGYQRDLRGENPAYEDLWNEPSGDKNSKGWRPKKEDAVSNHISRHLGRDLEERGVVVNREVQIRPYPSGQRTDIQVDAVPRLSAGTNSNTLRVIIEVKGSWNRSLKTAMDRQLKGRYLKENDCHDGIYLVAWFNCGHWDPQDRRLQVAKSWNWDLEQARAQLAAQAEDLTTEDCRLSSFVVDARLGQGHSRNRRRPRASRTRAKSSSLRRRSARTSS